MNPADYQASTAGRLVKTRIALTPYWAFVPNALPPDLALDWPLGSRLSEAEYQLGLLAGLAASVSDPHLLINPLMRREAVLSSRIEGTHTGIPELLAYQSGHRLPGYSQSDQALLENREVLNYVDALDFGLQSIKNKPLSLDLIGKLHAVLLNGVRGNEFPLGEFREIQNFIGRTNDPEDAVFIPVPVEELTRQLKAFEAYLLNGNHYPPLVRAALIHYQFEVIHPFLDGNGRVGRLMIVLLLSAWNLMPVPLLYPSAFIERNRERYFECLLNVSKKGAWTDWLIFFLDMIADQAGDTIRRCTALIELKKAWLQILHQRNVSNYYHQIIDTLFTNPVVSVSDIEKQLGVTNKAARSMVENLVDFEILSLVEEKKYARVYQADRLIHILQEH